MPKEKVDVPVVEPKTTSCVEYIELGRTVTPQPEFRKILYVLDYYKEVWVIQQRHLIQKSIGNMMFHGL